MAEIPIQSSVLTVRILHYFVLGFGFGGMSQKQVQNIAYNCGDNIFKFALVVLYILARYFITYKTFYSIEFNTRILSTNWFGNAGLKVLSNGQPLKVFDKRLSKYCAIGSQSD